MEAIVGDSQMVPVVGGVGSIGSDCGNLVRSVCFEGEEETRVPVPVITHWSDA